jgi:hypothetical protein
MSKLCPDMYKCSKRGGESCLSICCAQFDEVNRKCYVLTTVDLLDRIAKALENGHVSKTYDGGQLWTPAKTPEKVSTKDTKRRVIDG